MLQHSTACRSTSKTCCVGKLQPELQTWYGCCITVQHVATQSKHWRRFCRLTLSPSAFRRSLSRPRLRCPPSAPALPPPCRRRAAAVGLVGVRCCVRMSRIAPRAAVCSQLHRARPAALQAVGRAGHDRAALAGPRPITLHPLPLPCSQLAHRTRCYSVARGLPVSREICAPTGWLARGRPRTTTRQRRSRRRWAR